MKNVEKTIFTIGAGRGLGNAVSRKFASNGFHAVLMSRSAGHLDEYRREFAAEGFQIDTLTADAAERASLDEAMKSAIERFGVPDVLFYNVGITGADRDAGVVDAELMMRRYAADVAGAYSCVSRVMGDEFSRKNGAILITGGGLSIYPNAEYLPLSMDKAALRAMVLALHPVYKERNVYIGSVQVCDFIGGSEKYMPDRIAELFWKMYRERKEAEIVY